VGSIVSGDLMGVEPVELSGHWPAGLPTGICTTSWRDGEPWIDHADPRIVISALIVDTAALKMSPYMSLTMTGQTVANGHVGALLKLHAANRQVIYQLTEWVPSIRAYVGEWPE
jgi:hypothetical protein